MARRQANRALPRSPAGNRLKTHRQMRRPVLPRLVPKMGQPMAPARNRRSVREASPQAPRRPGASATRPRGCAESEKQEALRRNGNRDRRSAIGAPRPPGCFESRRACRTGVEREPPRARFVGVSWHESRAWLPRDGEPSPNEPERRRPAIQNKRPAERL